MAVDQTPPPPSFAYAWQQKRQCSLEVSRHVQCCTLLAQEVDNIICKSTVGHTPVLPEVTQESSATHVAASMPEYGDRSAAVHAMRDPKLQHNSECAQANAEGCRICQCYMPVQRNGTYTVQCMQWVGNNMATVQSHHRHFSNLEQYTVRACRAVTIRQLTITSSATRQLHSTVRAGP